jgi:Ca2+-binding EF-hand superfamily protein
MIREMMVDKFQQLDGDGDGAITAEEMTAPADMMDRMERMRARTEQKHEQPGGGMGMGNSTMKNDN